MLPAINADTVKLGVGIEPVIENGVIRSKGKTILGADDKAGIAEMLEVLRIAEVRPRVEVAISRQEEVDTYGAKAEVIINNLCKAVDIPENNWTVQASKKALKKAGVNATTTFITGFTDASVYNNHNIEMAVVGIGARLEHSLEEHIYIEDMKKALIMIVELLRFSAE